MMSQERKYVLSEQKEQRVFKMLHLKIYLKYLKMNAISSLKEKEEVSLLEIFDSPWFFSFVVLV